MLRVCERIDGKRTVNKRIDDANKRPRLNGDFFDFFDTGDLDGFGIDLYSLAASDGTAGSSLSLDLPK
jgi:hypothetical protein